MKEELKFKYDIARSNAEYIQFNQNLFLKHKDVTDAREFDRLYGAM
jgi:hypothetical protein